MNKIFDTVLTHRHKNINTKMKKRFCIPHEGNVSIMLGEILNKKDNDSQITFSTSNQLNNDLFSEVKGPAPCPSQEQQGVVHPIPCLACDGIYIGETSQYLERRILHQSTPDVKAKPATPSNPRMHPSCLGLTTQKNHLGKQRKLNQFFRFPLFYCILRNPDRDRFSFARWCSPLIVK